MRRRLSDLADANRKVAEYENKLTLISQEVERLNGNLRNKLDEISSLEQKNRTLVQEIEMLRRKNSENEMVIVQEWQTKYNRILQDNDDLRKRLTELSEVNRKIAEYENQIALLSQEIERLNAMLRNKTDELRQRESEIEVLKRRNSELEYSITQEWTIKVNRMNQENEELRRRVSDLGEVNRKLSEYENKITLLSNEIERLNMNLKKKVDEL